MNNATSPDSSPSPLNSVDLKSPWRWIRLGWRDLLRNPMPGLAHGLLLAVFGWLLLWVARDRFWLLAGAFSGFLIVAPILATGLYSISKADQEGSRAGLRSVIALWRSGDGRLVRFGLLLGLAGTGWVLTSAGLITLWSPVPIERPVDFLQHVVLVPEPGLFEVWVLLGALLAAPVYASSVIALPMLVDTSVPVSMAVAQSWRTVASYPGPMVVWALMIAVLMAAGMMTALVGLVVLVPLVGHASWHAYCDLVGRGESGLSSSTTGPVDGRHP
ncbi:MAG: hypothetical protein C0453_10585 [Comamonadaceae bacterium]|nr:hypothetical protein [Comamonadaceae bacterium]